MSGAQDRQELVSKTVEACVEYQSGKLDEGEVEDLMIEIEEESVVRIMAAR